ncbi:hypothetical protein F7725_022985, partial [Dissostichus mawsoni]
MLGDLGQIGEDLPSTREIWSMRHGSPPSSSKTCNIYKPLRRINQKGTGGAALPITSTRPSGCVTVDVMDLCHAEGFNHAALGQDQQPREGQRPGAELGQHFSQTLRLLLCPLVTLVGVGDGVGDGEGDKEGEEGRGGAGDTGLWLLASTINRPLYFSGSSAVPRSLTSNISSHLCFYTHTEIRRLTVISSIREH